jgi:hypothetical protein
LRIDVKGDEQPKFIVRPLVADWYQREWHNSVLKPLVI